MTALILCIRVMAKCDPIDDILISQAELAKQDIEVPVRRGTDEKQG